MKLSSIVGAIALGASAAQGQKLATWSNNTAGVSIAIGIPQGVVAPFDILVSVTAPVATGWVGYALGGCMLRNPLIVTWPNGKGVTNSPRWASAYHPPALYNGTTVTTYTTSAVNATHWTANYLCSGCSKWEGFALDPKGVATFGYGISSRPVDTPSNPAASIRFHDIAKDHFELDLNTAQLAKADWDTAVKSFGAAVSPAAASSKAPQVNA